MQKQTININHGRSLTEFLLPIALVLFGIFLLFSNKALYRVIGIVDLIFWGGFLLGLLGEVLWNYFKRHVLKVNVNMEKYIYYLDEFGDYYTYLYRMPNNGKDGFENSVAGMLEKYAGVGFWFKADKSEVKRLQNGESNGEFNFRNAEIKDQSELDAIIKKIDSPTGLK